MIVDLSDPVGTIQMIVSVLILVELIQFLDKDDMGAHIQERVKFYSGIFGKVWGGLGKFGGFLKLAGSGFGIIFRRLFPGKEKDREPVDPSREIFQMEEKEDPVEGEGAIEG